MDTRAAPLAPVSAGLATAEAADRLRRFGPNVLVESRAGGWWALLGRQFANPLVLILVFGAAVSLLVGDWTEAALILTIVIGSAVLGFSQEYRADAAVARLRRRLALTARVVRDGVACDVDVATLVPGDVVMLSAGNLVPADGKLLEARDFLVSEAALTGESFPVEKRPGAPAFMGTSVRSGMARLEVTATGRATAYGAIAARLRAPEPETDFARGVRQFGYLLMRVMVATVVFVLVINQWLGRPVLESFLFAIALAVGISPELLPAIVSVTLARGAREMAARGVLVRRLEAIENLGTMDVLCADKTGTLTEAQVELREATDAQGAPSHRTLQLACLNAAFETGIENPLDRALVQTARAAGLDTRGWRKVDEIPYDFIRRRLTIVACEEAAPGSPLMITKGAVENVLAACALDAAAAERARELFRARSAEGYRVLAVASRRLEAREAYAREDERDMALEGFLLFVDPVKSTASEAVRSLDALGIRVVVVTGDNRHVAAHVAREVGLDGGRILTGPDLAAMREEALLHGIDEVRVFAEVDPQQKERIVRALRRCGRVVGFLGDGINDAPALRAADVGISVDDAVDVARESADVVLLRPDLEVLRRGVEHGRRTFANTLKYITITASANFGNMLSMALVTPLMPFLPLAAKQILLNNFLSDVPMIAVSTDRVDPESLERAQRWDTAGVRSFMVVFGLVSSVFDLLTFWLLLEVFDAGEPVFQTAWFVVSLLTELVVVLVLRTRRAAWRSLPSGLLLATTIAITAAAIALPYLGALSAAFGFVALPAGLMGTAIAIVAAYALATEAAKRHFHRQRQA